MCRILVADLCFQASNLVLETPVCLVLVLQCLGYSSLHSELHDKPQVPDDGSRRSGFMRFLHVLHGVGAAIN